MKNLSSFKELVGNYDYFLFDQWGVLHNGHQKFKKAEHLTLQKQTRGDGPHSTLDSGQLFLTDGGSGSQKKQSTMRS